MQRLAVSRRQHLMNPSSRVPTPERRSRAPGQHKAYSQGSSRFIHGRMTPALGSQYLRVQNIAAGEVAEHSSCRETQQKRNEQRPGGSCI